MFDVDCPGCQARTLLGPRNITALENTDAGIVLRWRCRCGSEGSLCLRKRWQEPVDPEDRGAAA